MTDLSDVRIAYNSRSQAFLESSLVVKEPIALFTEWFEQARNTPNVGEAQAMCLSTATKDGFPSARYVLCKAFGKDGFKFFTHYTSQKGQDLEENPKAALTFFWAPLNKQVRIEGRVEKLSMDEAEEYFSKRPYASQLGALCSNQSKPIPGRHVLLEKEAELKAAYSEGEVPKPELWGGYLVVPKSIEFWQGQTDRIHDRIKFYSVKESGKVSDDVVTFKGDEGWVYERLAP